MPEVRSHTLLDPIVSTGSRPQTLHDVMVVLPNIGAMAEAGATSMSVDAALQQPGPALRLMRAATGLSEVDTKALSLRDVAAISATLREMEAAQTTPAADPPLSS